MDLAMQKLRQQQEAVVKPMLEQCRKQVEEI